MPAAPSTTTTPATIAAGGMDRFSLRTSVLFTANGHLSNLQCRGGDRAAEDQVGADGFDAHQHLLEVARNGHFGNREGQFAVADPQTYGAARIIAGDDIDAEAHHFGHIESIGNTGD